MDLLHDYIKKGRAAKLTDETIRSQLVNGGWAPDVVDAALSGKELPPVPPPPPPPPGMSGVQSGPPKPVAVVTTYSTKGLEYWIMFLAMGISALSLAWILHNTIDNLFASSSAAYGSDQAVSFAASALLVALPIFVVLFLRLKHAELKDPQLYDDPSRRRAVQLTMIITFLVGIGNVIAYIYSLLNADQNSDAFQNFLHMLVTLAIAGGIFAFYWVDQHKKAS